MLVWLSRTRWVTGLAAILCVPALFVLKPDWDEGLTAAGFAFAVLCSAAAVAHGIVRRRARQMVAGAVLRIFALAAILSVCILVAVIAWYLTRSAP